MRTPKLPFPGIVAALALAACASTEQAAAPQTPAYVAPPPARLAVTPAPPPDQCGARELAWLVGRPRTEIPVPVEITNRRVLCTTCPRTEEHMPRRLNIFFDQDTGVVQQVTCG